MATFPITFTIFAICTLIWIVYNWFSDITPIRVTPKISSYINSKRQRSATSIDSVEVSDGEEILLNKPKKKRGRPKKE
ncbi:hypothetical protein PV326_003749 [Microctonus aethiopoides]|nr:hypothetical protein PV326_003749 [Microctonus aethiopoides]